MNDLKELEFQVNSYITNPGSRLLVILDNDSSIARETVIQCCQAKGLVLTRDTHYSSNLPIPTQIIREPNKADVLLEDYINLLSDLKNFDGVFEKAVQFKDSYAKSVIIIGGFVIPNDSIWKNSDRIILFDANSFDFWLSWAMSKDQYGRHNIHPKITAFLEQHPEWLEPLPKDGQIAVTTRYTWKGASDSIKRRKIDADDLENISKEIAGVCGTLAAEAFLGFYK